MKNKTQIYSAVATLLVCIAVVVWMMLDSITISGEDKTWPPKHDSEIVIDDEYVELLDVPLPKTNVVADPSLAYNETVENNKAEAAPETGMETVDQGVPGEAPAPVVQTKPSPVKVEKKDKPVKQGPSAEELKKQQEEKEARRKATMQTKSAFANAGKNNANNGKEEGNAGSPKGTQSAVNGHGTGYVGGGWSLPRYNEVPSSLTGSVEMKVLVDRSGNVKSVTFIGGTAPAATDPAVRAACEREVRARKFTRTDPDAPDESTAYITYKFR